MYNKSIIAKLAEGQSGWITCKIQISMNPPKKSKYNLSKDEEFKDWKYQSEDAKKSKISQRSYVNIKMRFIGQPEKNCVKWELKYNYKSRVLDILLSMENWRLETDQYEGYRKT